MHFIKEEFPEKQNNELSNKLLSILEISNLRRLETSIKILQRVKLINERRESEEIMASDTKLCKILNNLQTI